MFLGKWRQGGGGTWPGVLPDLEGSAQGRAWRCQAPGGLVGLQPRCGGGRWTAPGRAAGEKGAPAASPGPDGLPGAVVSGHFVPGFGPRGAEGGPWRRSGRWASPPRPGLDPGPAGFWTLAVRRHLLGRGNVAFSEAVRGPRRTPGSSSCLAHGVGREGGRDGVFGFLGRNRPSGKRGRVLANQEETTGRRLGWSTVGQQLEPSSTS